MLTLNVKVCDNQLEHFDTDIEDLDVGDYVIVETDNGSEWGVAVSVPAEKKQNTKDNAMVLRKADEKDMRQVNLLLKSAVYAKA
jgi:cell fate regulator YaaT (PSP1 superfamily)